MDTRMVTWSMLVNANDDITAAKKAWSIMEDAVIHNITATVFSVEDNYGHSARYLMENPDDPKRLN